MLNRAWSGFFLSVLFAGGFVFLGACNPLIAQDCCSEAAIYQPETQDLEANPALEQELLALVNQHRMENGLPALSLDSTLTQVAREHSHGMANQGFISHNLPSGNLKMRLAKAGYLHEIARENVASAPSLIRAQNALIESPGHDSNLLATDVSQIGIGIARCPSPYGSQLYITQIFASPRDEYRPEMVEEALATRVDELRQNGAGAMILDPGLEKIASHSLLSIPMPYRSEDLRDLLTASAGELPDAEKARLSRLRANVQLVHNPKHVNIPNYAAEGQARSYGAAVRQIQDSRNQSAFLVLTLIGIGR
ncbi:MAG: CAP domain-containing protein [Acidobacteriota bacterium]|jgi:uncharacterized protein YkwD|nr:CAP domain-containing protein [Acidobacteriota bacterium]